MLAVETNNLTTEAGLRFCNWCKKIKKSYYLVLVSRVYFKNSTMPFFNLLEHHPNDVFSSIFLWRSYLDKARRVAGHNVQEIHYWWLQKRMCWNNQCNTDLTTKCLLVERRLHIDWFWFWLCPLQQLRTSRTHNKKTRREKLVFFYFRKIENWSLFFFVFFSWTVTSSRCTRYRWIRPWKGRRRYSAAQPGW